MFRSSIRYSFIKRLFHDPAQPPTKHWKPSLSENDRFKLRQVYNNRKQLKQESIKHIPVSSEPISDDTRKCLSMIREQQKFYATVEINTKPYSVTLNDIVITKRLPGLHVGNKIKLTNIKEFGSKDYFIRGSPFVDKRFCDIEAMVLENTESAKYTKYLRRVGKGGGDRKWRKRSYRDKLSILRITKINVPEIL